MWLKDVVEMDRVFEGMNGVPEKGVEIFLPLNVSTHSAAHYLCGAVGEGHYLPNKKPPLLEAAVILWVVIENRRED